MNSLGYSFQIVKQIFKGGFYKIFLFFLFLLGVNIFTTYNISNIVPITIDSIRFLLGLTYHSLLDLIWLMYQIGLTIYLSYLYFFYEIDNSPEFIFLRTDSYHFAIKKYFVFVICLVLFRILFYLFAHFVFLGNIAFSLSVFLWNIVLHVSIVTTIFICSVLPILINLKLLNKNHSK